MLLLPYRGVRFHLNSKRLLVVGRDSSANYIDAGCITGRDLLFDNTRPNKLLANVYHTLSSQGQSGPSVKITHTPTLYGQPSYVGTAPISVTFFISLIVFQKSTYRSSSNGYRDSQIISESALCNRKACH